MRCINKKYEIHKKIFKIKNLFLVYFERLQDKLVQVKDTRAALDAMRDDHKAAIQQEAAFAEQQRQIQLAMKLDVLRQRKQQYQQVITN